MLTRAPLAEVARRAACVWGGEFSQPQPTSATSASTTCVKYRARAPFAPYRSQLMSARNVFAGLIACLLCASLSAHVTVWPRESQPGTYEKYVVRVPTEGKVATASVELTVPDGVTIVSMAAPTGFKYELKRTGERVTRIVWSMPIAPGEFAEFAFMARNPKDKSELTWKATQHFADGTEIAWTGPKGDKHPAPITTLKTGT
jgi:uncharacterized protein YcnI